MTLSEQIIATLGRYQADFGKDPDIIVLSENEYKELSSLATGLPNKPMPFSAFMGIKVIVSKWTDKFFMTDRPKDPPLFGKDFIFDDNLHKPRPIRLPSLA